MKNLFKLEVNSPCQENFNEFKPTERGGFCKSCQKDVIDFTKMNSNQIINYIQNNKNICGKFNENQLKTYSKPSKKYSFWSGIGLACLSLFSINTSNAQSQTNDQKSSKKLTQTQDKTFNVSGVVSDESGLLPGTSVILEGTTIGIETDFDGKFIFPKKLKKGDVLVFSFIGFNSKKIVIDNNNSASKIDMKVDMNLSSCIIMGKVANKKVYKSKRK